MLNCFARNVIKYIKKKKGTLVFFCVIFFPKIVPGLCEGGQPGDEPADHSPHHHQGRQQLRVQHRPGIPVYTVHCTIYNSNCVITSFSKTPLYLYNIHSAICRPSDHPVGRPRAKILTRDGQFSSLH